MNNPIAALAPSRFFEFFSGVNYSQDCSETMTMTVSLPRDTVRSAAETATLAASILKDVVRALAEVPSLSALLVKDTARAVAETATLADSVPRDTTRALSEAPTLSASLLKDAVRALAETATLTPSAVKDLVRTLRDCARIDAQPVVWQNLIKAVASGSTITRNVGGGAWDAGGASVQSLASGAGYVEFTIAVGDSLAAYRVLGLNNGDPGGNYGLIDFAILLEINGYIWLYENSVALTTFGNNIKFFPGDVLRVEIVELDPLVLKRTAFSAGWNQSGASSVETLASGDGYVESTIIETDTYRMFGLSHGDTNQDYTDIDYAWYPGQGSTFLHVYEGGVDKGSMGTYAPGDVLRVAVEGGVVKYRKNGTLMYTSLTPPTYPLLVDTALYGDGATISHATLGGGFSATGPVTWTNRVGCNSGSQAKYYKNGVLLAASPTPVVYPILVAASLFTAASHVDDVRVGGGSWSGGTPLDVALKATSRALPESLASTDALVRAAVKSLAETVTSADSVVRDSARTLSESSTYSDALATSVGLFRTLSEALGWDDVVVRGLAYEALESLALTDDMERVFGIIRELLETLGLSEDFAVARAYARTLAETLTLVALAVRPRDPTGFFDSLLSNIAGGVSSSTTSGSSLLAVRTLDGSIKRIRP